MAGSGGGSGGRWCNVDDAEFSDRMNLAWQLASTEIAMSHRNGDEVLDWLDRFYDGLTESEQAQANKVLRAWLLEGDSAREFDALHMVRTRKLREALPELRELADRYERSEAPLAPANWAVVNRIVGQLVEAAPDW